MSFMRSSGSEKKPDFFPYLSALALPINRMVRLA